MSTTLISGRLDDTVVDYKTVNRHSSAHLV